jgi:hypothetical protein
VIDQGVTAAAGLLDVLGAQTGDSLQVLSLNGALSGAASVPIAGCLALGSSARTSDGVETDLNLQLRPTAESGVLTGIAAIVTGASPAEALTYTPAGADHVGPSISLAYNTSTGDYRGQSNFIPAALAGYGRLQNNAQTIDLLVDYRLQWAGNAAEADIFSNDGNFRLSLDAGAFASNESYFLIASPWRLPGPLPEGWEIASEAYEITAVALNNGAELTQLSKPAILRLHYDPATRPNLASFAIYRWNVATKSWQSLGGTVNLEQQETVTTVTNLGVYVLLGQPANKVYLPQVVK